MKLRPALGLAVAAVYALFSYGGIRSPDGEVLYRTAESLVRDGDFSIEPLEAWPGFGVAQGRGGVWYGKYGPGVPLVAAPLVWVGLHVGALDGARGLAGVGPSHFFGDGYDAMRTGRAPRDAKGHVARTVASLFNVLVGAAAAMTLFRALERLALTRAGTIAGTLAFAFATPMLPYGGTFFTEPLVSLCLLAAVAGLLEPDASPRDLLLPGAWLGLAVVCHATALVWLPFLGAYVAIATRRAATVAAFLAGSAVAAMSLAAFDAARFGSVLETGRPPEDFLFDAPLRHAWPLLASWGKGLVVYCPLALVGLAAWPLLLGRRRLLGWLLAGGVLARLALFAAFHDWHGGFGPGPRYPLPEVAIVALAAALALDRLLARGGRWVAAALALVGLGICEQAWVAAGEVFSWCHRWRAIFEARGADVFAHDLLYRSFELSPLAPAYGLEGVCGPALGRALGMVPATFAALAAAALCAGSTLAILRGRA